MTLEYARRTARITKLENDRWEVLISGRAKEGAWSLEFSGNQDRVEGFATGMLVSVEAVGCL